MPRKPRLFIPHQPVHIVKRGHNRGPIVARKVDYYRFVSYLFSECERYGVALHAWVLMTNHFHLLASPTDEAGIPNMMKGLCGHYARYFNKTYSRSGSMWEGRYKTSLIDSDDYLLKCYRYIELNPVNAGMVEHPAKYMWSSYHFNAYGKCFEFPEEYYTEQVSGLKGARLKSGTRVIEMFGDRLKPIPGEIQISDSSLASYEFEQTSKQVTPHDVYISLAKDRTKRCENYKGLFNEVLERSTLLQFQRSIEKGRPVGNPEFLLKVAKLRAG